MRNVLARVPKGTAEMVAAAIRTIFAQPDAEHVRSQLDVIAGMFGRQFPAVETMLREAAPKSVRRYLSEGSMALIIRPTPTGEVAQLVLLAAQSPHR
jgi:transposase-like protein